MKTQTTGTTRKGKDLLGLMVVGHADGTQLGRVKDMIFDQETDQVVALVLSDKDLFGLIDAQIVPWHQVRSVGSDVILVESSESKLRLQDDECMRDLANRETSLSGTQIITTEGQHLGTLADMCIDEASGRVVGYEVSGGFVTDTLRGKKFLPAPPGLLVGKDVAVAPPAAATQLETRK